jgi:hypothetical protein
VAGYPQSTGIPARRPESVIPTSPAREPSRPESPLRAPLWTPVLQSWSVPASFPIILRDHDFHMGYNDDGWKQGTAKMFRTQLPRLQELRDLIPDPTSPNAYFQNFDTNLRDSCTFKDFHTRWENALQGLDEEAWKFLKSESTPYLICKDRRGRGWQQLFDILNQAHGFNYLKAIGCSNLRFIPRAVRPGVRTPDLEGVLGSDKVLCEVKTINISQDEIRARTDFTARSFLIPLEDGLLRKIHSVITEAKDQLLAYAANDKVPSYVYVNICFDDCLAERKAAYFQQIDHFLADLSDCGIDLVFHNDHTTFHKVLAMTNAVVDNAA